MSSSRRLLAVFLQRSLQPAHTHTAYMLGLVHTARYGTDRDVTLLRRTLSLFFLISNALVAVSKNMQAVKLRYNKILKFSRICQ